MSQEHESSPQDDHGHGNGNGVDQSGVAVATEYDALPRSLLSAHNIVKCYGSLVANHQVNLALQAGEIHALLGENGAGKSTLVKMIGGLIQPDSGWFEFDGQRTPVRNPEMSRKLGVGVVHQHFSLVEAMRVDENLALGIPGTTAGRHFRRHVQNFAERYGLNIELDTELFHLSMGQRQQVEILRCLLQAPKILILDEPTSVLTPQEAERLFTILRRLAGEGRSIVYISHKLEEVRRLCHTATIMRGGRVVDTCDPARLSVRELAEAMLGQDLRVAKRNHNQQPGRTIFAVRGLSLPPANERSVALKEINFDLAEGQVFGIAGIAGNGQNELFSVISGERKAKKNQSIVLHDMPIGHASVGEKRRLGLGSLPENRLGHAAVGGLTLWENVLLTHIPRGELIRKNLINHGESLLKTTAITSRFGVKARGPLALASALSGGNLQKLIVGREIVQSPSVLLVSQPTAGVDANAAADIRRELINLAERGAGVIVISQDLDELLEISDRISVLSGGWLTEIHFKKNWTAEIIGRAMSGDHAVSTVA